MKKLIALAVVAGFLAAGSIGCNKDTGTKAATKSSTEVKTEATKKDKP